MLLVCLTENVISLKLMREMLLVFKERKINERKCY